MDSIRKSLFPLNIALHMSGCPIFLSKNKIVNILSRIHCLIILVSHFPIVVLNISIGIRSEHPFVVRGILHAWNTFSYIISFLTIVLILKARPKLARLMLSMQLTRKDHKNIYRFTLLQLSLNIGLPLVVRGFALLSFLRGIDSVNKSFSYMLGYALFSYGNIHFWYIISMVLYLSMLKVIDLNEDNVINDCKTNAEDPKCMTRTLTQLIDLKNQISDSISFLILCIYFRLFLATIGSICRLNLLYADDKVSQWDMLYSVFSLFRISIEVSLVIYLACQVDCFARNSRNRLDSLTRFIIETKDPNEWSFVLIRIKESRQFEYNAFNTFVINKNSLLSFATSFVSLTVLFVQLINQQYQPQTQVTMIGYHG